jgi:hypothetical protein
MVADEDNRLREEHEDWSLHAFHEGLVHTYTIRLLRRVCILSLFSQSFGFGSQDNQTTSLVEAKVQEGGNGGGENQFDIRNPTPIQELKYRGTYTPGSIAVENIRCDTSDSIS